MEIDQYRNKILQGHALDILKKLPANSIDCVCTSSPYWGLRDYQTEPIIWDDPGNCPGHDFGEKQFKKFNFNTNSSEFQRPWREGASSDKVVKGTFCKHCSAWNGSLGLEPNFQLFIDHLIQIFTEVKRVLKTTGSFWVNLGDTHAGTGHKKGIKDPKYPEGRNAQDFAINNDVPGVQRKSLVGIPDRLKIAMIDAGWVCRNDIIWHKPSSLPSSAKDRFTIDYERLFFFTKSPKYYFEQQFEPLLLDSIRPSKRGKINLKGGERQALDSWSMQYDDEYLKYIKTEYKGQAQKDYSAARAQNPSDTKRRILKAMNQRLMRNKRAVWRINPKGYPGSHFAVFPEKLVETPIKATCPRDICVKCAEPYRKIYNQTSIPRTTHIDKYIEHVQKSEFSSLRIGGSGLKKHRLDHPIKTTYSKCSCNAELKPGIALDPFFGRGTTGKVAHSLGRDFIGIELNPEYIKLAKEFIGPLTHRLSEFF